MDALKYIKERNRMCRHYPLCKGCPIDKLVEYGSCFDDLEENNPEKIIEEVEKWSKEHPFVTNGDMVYKMFSPQGKEWWNKEYKEQS